MRKKTKEIWDKLAPWWDEAYQEGDIFHRAFLFPTILEWTDAKPGMRILDIGCGNGTLARIFSKAGANVLATDFSEVFIEKAKQRSQNFKIDFRIIDATDKEQLDTLITEKPFDRIICSMALHDMPTITPLISSLPNLLNDTGIFIFSVPHPCFNSGLVETEELKKQMDKKQLILPNRYIREEAFEILAKPGQPIKQISFHRPLSGLFSELFKAGLVMTGFVEPTVKPEDLPDGYLWAKLPEVPPSIISRWRKG